MSARRTYRGRFGALLLIPVGLIAVAVAIGAPVLLWRTEGDPWIALVVGTIPALTGGILALLNGYAAAATRIVISDAGVSIRAPTWRGAPFPPLRRLDARWSAVTAVLRRRELFDSPVLLLFSGIDVPVYQVRAGAQRVTLGGRTVWALSRAMTEVALRAGRPVSDLPTVRARIWGSLAGRAPPWPEDPGGQPPA